MPKSATADLTHEQFLRTLKRNGFSEFQRITGNTYEDSETGAQYPGLYAGKFFGATLQRRLTIKHLLASRAAFGTQPTKATRAKPERKKRNASPAGAESTAPALPL